MNEHQKLFWLPKEQIIDLDWAAADLPIVRKITEDKGFMCSN